MRHDHLKRLVQDVPDFPSPGILFRDITPLLLDPVGFAEAVDILKALYEGEGVELVAAIESRGFVLGAPLALALGCGFAPIRKAGKLPRATVGKEYALEYGTNRLEVHRDAIESGQKVLIIDDVLATGGTARATIDLVRELGGVVAGFACLLEITSLEGRLKLQNTRVDCLLSY